MLGARPVAGPARDVAAVDGQDQHVLGEPQQGDGVAGGAGGLARAVPGDQGPPRRQHGRAAARDHQRRVAAVHERRLGQRRVVDPVAREVGPADDGQVGVPGVAGQQVRQPVQGAALAHGREGDPLPVGLRPRRRQDRFGLGLGVRQVLAQEVGRQVAPAHPGQERLGDQVERGHLRPARLGERQGRLQARPARRRFVQVDQEILDRHRRLRLGGGSARSGSAYSWKASSRLARMVGSRTTTRSAGETSSRARLKRVGDEHAWRRRG